MIALMIGILVFLSVLVIIRLKKYIQGANAAGDVIMVLGRPVKAVISGAVIYLFIAYILNGHGIGYGGVDFSALLVLAIGAINVCFDIKPQVICEYGIVTANGLIPWENIEGVASMDEKSNLVRINLIKYVRDPEMKVICPAGEVHAVAALIESKSNKETEA